MKLVGFKNEKVKATKQTSIKLFDKASVNIEKKEVELDPNSYVKRKKIFDSKGNWIQTQPLVVNNKDII